MKKILGLLAVLAFSVTSGCASYHLGSMLPDDVKTVHVPTFANKTREPQLETETTQQTIREFQRDGSLKIATKESADAILNVTITDYQLRSVRYDRNRATRTESYRLYLTANVILINSKTGKIIVERPGVRGQAVFDVAGDLTTSKLNALPEAARDLAHNIVETCVEVW